jgi:hypothetical protein
MRQHHSPAPYAHRARPGGDLADEDLRAGAGEVRQIMMLGDPETLIAHGLGGDRQGNGLLQGFRGGATVSDGRLIEHTQLQ